MSLRNLIKLAALASTCWMSVGQALAENRIALVIGNSNYTSVTALPNPANDAKAMTNFLNSAGFQVVQAPDLTQSDMRRTIADFAKKVTEKGPDTVALVFYAGHGLQVDGENYLVPVDAQIERESDVPLQATRLADLMNVLSSVPSKSNIVILDACRNNPFSAINKTAGRGLAIVDAPNGSIVSYSTAPGTEALDGDGQNSPYTTALTKIGHEPGLQIEQLLKRVRLDVSNTTARQQFPWESSSLTVEFSFFPSGSAQQAAAPATKSQPATTTKARSEARSVEAWQKELKSKNAREAYELVVREDQVEGYQAYLALYPSQSTASAVRSLSDRRQVMVAWYTAVTINTVASYQAFLASYGTSDFAATADRLIDRARARSVSGGAAAAFASVSPTCPCSLPATPTLRQRRTDTTPTQTPTQNTGSNSGGGAPKANLAVIDPVPVIIPTNPVVTLPPRISVYPKPPRGHDKPKDTSGNDKPKSTGGSYGDKPKSSGGSNSDNSRGARGHNNDTPRTRVTNNAGASNVVRATAVKPIMSPVSMGIGLRAFGGMGMGRAAWEWDAAWEAAAARRACRTGAGCTDVVDRKKNPAKVGPWRGLRRAAQRGGLSRASSGMCHANPQKRLCPVTGKAPAANSGRVLRFQHSSPAVQAPPSLNADQGRRRTGRRARRRLRPCASPARVGTGHRGCCPARPESTAGW